MTIELRTARLVVRTLSQADRGAWIKVRRDNAEHWKQWMPASEPGLSDDQRFDEWLTRSMEAAQRGTGRRFGAFDSAGAIVGFCGLNNIVRGAFLNADMGWMIARSCEGRGLASEMIRAVLDHAFAPEPPGGTGLGLHRVQANIIPSNERSLRLAQRLGFRREGVAVRMLKIDGEWQDHVVHAVLADEWRTGAGR